MWCLLMSDLHVGKASTMEIPSLPSPTNACNLVSNDLESVDNNGVGVMSPRDIECPKRFNLSPSMKALLKMNVAIFAASFRANSKQMQTQNQAFVGTFSRGDAPLAVSGGEVSAEKSEESQTARMRLIQYRIKDLEKQVKERKDWAHQKAMQVAKKLSSDLTELKMLRMEREEMQRMKKGKHTIEDSTMKRLSEMENALRKASIQVDRANVSFAKREKKWLKKLLAWKKQKAKLQELIADEKEKIKDLQRCLTSRSERNRVKVQRVVKGHRACLCSSGAGRCSNEATEASNKRKLEALRLKIEIDFQRHKDDHQRLEHELSRLKLSDQSTELNHQSDNLLTGKSEGVKPQGETITKLLHELDTLEDSSENEVNGDRECIVCSKDEVFVVFLPCTHQVLCAKCNDNFGKKGKATCPCCRVPIEQRIRVYGASS
ncbi:hypothetical protein F3Y22_tig00110818pilonHSYRG00027 [Hibiscus syriacus]|uniref:RING-type domain-containing protein n=1 Tax=Hibiscus syriacus TaxID=106335 RepID=A0A6A2ZMA2_HIBSY|nr:hypothetical protein F3Y22_tig00110818pilonHSYRG00027 [Hibiscus syriacus]